MTFDLYSDEFQKVIGSYTTNVDGEIKIDKDNHEVKLKGVKFDVLDEKGNILETITTNEKGEAYTSRYAIRDYSKLTI